MVVDRLGLWKPTKERPVRLTDVEEWILRAHKSYRLKGVVGDDWQFIPLAERLRGRGLRVVTQHFSQSLNNQIALTIHGALRDRSLHLLNDEGLITELASAPMKETAPHVYKLDADPGVEGHLDRLAALGLVLLQLIDRQPADLTGLSIPVMWAPSSARVEDEGLRELPPAPVVDVWHRR